MSAQAHDVPASEERWVAVVRVGKTLWAVGPLPAHSATLAMTGLVEGWPDAERVGVAELVAPGEARDRLSQPPGASHGGRAEGVLRPLPRRGEQGP